MQTEPTLRRRLRVQSRSVQGVVTKALASLILKGEIPEGAVLPNEAELMTRFGMSRTVLRESIKTLSAKGLVEARPKIGTRVLAAQRWQMFDPDILAWRMALGIDARFMTELFEIRQVIEPAAAALASARRQPAHLDRMRAALAIMGQAGQTAQGFADADLAFHLAVLDASANSMMRGIGAVIETALATSFMLSSPVNDPVRHRNTIAKHCMIADAVEAGDQLRASSAMESVIINPAVRHIEAFQSDDWDYDFKDERLMGSPLP